MLDVANAEDNSWDARVTVVKYRYALSIQIHAACRS